MDEKQLYQFIEDTLKEFGMYSDSAQILLFGTACQESSCGKYIEQLNNGPALGVFQMEPATHDDIWESVLNSRLDMSMNVIQTSNIAMKGAENLKFNLKYAVIMCRLQYWRFPEKLPATLNGAAKYWKKYYNTYKGAGTEEEFIKNFNRFYKKVLS